MAHQHKKHLIPHNLKYLLFFLGLFIIVGGGLAINRYGLSSTAEAITVIVGFIVLALGIVLE